MTDVGAHVRPTDDHAPGVYRVVGVGDDVTLLRVTDGDGRRAYTGELASVPADALDAYEVVSNPDAGFTPAAVLRNALQGCYWSVRRFV